MYSIQKYTQKDGKSCKKGIQCKFVIINDVNIFCVTHTRERENESENARRMKKGKKTERQ